MGMYTTITHPDDGRQLQIKTGDDDLDCYKLGDTVDWKVYKDHVWSSKLLDGAYESYSNKGEDDFVIIKNHVVHAIVPRAISADLYINHIVTKNDGVPKEPWLIMTEELWERVFDIEEPEEKLWTWEARRKNELTSAKYALISAIERYAGAIQDMGRAAEDLSKSNFSAMGEAISFEIWESLGRAGFAKQLFMTEAERKLTPSFEEKLHQRLLDKIEILRTTISKEDIKIWDKSAYTNDHRF